MTLMASLVHVNISMYQTSNFHISLSNVSFLSPSFLPLRRRRRGAQKLDEWMGNDSFETKSFHVVRSVGLLILFFSRARKNLEI